MDLDDVAGLVPQLAVPLRVDNRKLIKLNTGNLPNKGMDPIFKLV